MGPYDESSPLIIDPGLEFSTLVGGNTRDRVHEWRNDPFYVDEDGNTYVCGDFLDDFPSTPGAYDRTYNGRTDAFVFKLNSNGSALEYSTFLGGNHLDLGFAIVVDDEGAAYVAGNTNSDDFPTTSGVLQEKNASASTASDGFLTKISADGSSLVYSTYIGGSELEVINDLCLNPDGTIYVAGYTQSNDLPLSAGGFQMTHNGKAEGFLLKISSDANKVLYGTYYGGSGSDLADTLWWIRLGFSRYYRH
jgi:hypothetical protein